MTPEEAEAFVKAIHPEVHVWFSPGWDQWIVYGLGVHDGRRDLPLGYRTLTEAWLQTAELVACRVAGSTKGGET